MFVVRGKEITFETCEIGKTGEEVFETIEAAEHFKKTATITFPFETFEIKQLEE